MSKNKIPINGAMQQWIISRVVVIDLSRLRIRKVRISNVQNCLKNDVGYLSLRRQHFFGNEHVLACIEVSADTHPSMSSTGFASASLEGRRSSSAVRPSTVVVGFDLLRS